MKAMQLNEEFPALPMEDFQNYYIIVFELTSIQDAAEQMHYPELSAESLRLETFFQFPLEQVTEPIVLGERQSNIQIDKFGTVANMFNFFEISGSYKNIVIFWDFSLLLSLYYLFCFSSDLKRQKKERRNDV